MSRVSATVPQAGARALLSITPHDDAVHECTKLGAAVGHPTELGSTYEPQQRRPPQDVPELLREVRAQPWAPSSSRLAAQQKEKAPRIASTSKPCSWSSFAATVEVCARAPRMPPGQSMMVTVCPSLGVTPGSVKASPSGPQPRMEK